MVTWQPPEDMPANQVQAVRNGKQCGAKKKQAKGYCKQRPTAGQVGSRPHRCKNHGGYAGAPEGNSNNLKHGIYSKEVQPEEDELFEKIKQLKDFTQEIAIFRLQLIRAFKAKSRQETELVAIDTSNDLNKGLPVDGVRTRQIVRSDGTTEKILEISKKRIDFDTIIDRLVSKMVKLQHQQTMIETKGLMVPLEEIPPPHIVYRIPDKILKMNIKDKITVLEAVEKKENDNIYDI